MVNQSRIRYIDIAKGLGMLLVIWGHIKQGGLSSDFTYSFHMPFFFFISGMLFNPEKHMGGGTSFVINRVRRLLIPYVIYSLLTWGLWVGYSYLFHRPVESYIYPFAQIFLAQGSAGFIVHNVPLWFVTCLFLVEMLYFAIFKIFKKKSAIVSTLISVAVWYAVNSPLCPWVKELPWNFEVALIAIFFFACGNMLSSLISISNISNSVQTARGSIMCAIVFVSSLAITLSLAAVYGGVDMGADYFGTNPVVFYICGISGSIMMLSLSLLLEKFDFCKTDVIRNIGRYSIAYLALQIPVKGVVVVCIAKMFNVTISDAYFNDWTYAIMAFFITLVVLYVTIRIINYFKSKYNICYLI